VGSTRRPPVSRSGSNLLGEKARKDRVMVKIKQKLHTKPKHFSVRKKVSVPNPGSPDAELQGCNCPILDNYHGAGCGKGEDGSPAFWINAECPMHGKVK
jgi:hypothetical protein